MTAPAWMAGAALAGLMLAACGGGDPGAPVFVTAGSSPGNPTGDPPGNPQGPSPAAASANASPDAAAPASPPAACGAALDNSTWTQVYDTYLGAGTPGHCGNSGCHGDIANGGFLAGTTKDSFYAGWVQRGLIDPANPQQSLLLSPTLSPVRWFNPSGPMPLDKAVPNAAAAAAITAWLQNAPAASCGDAGAGDAAPSSAPAPACLGLEVNCTAGAACCTGLFCDPGPQRCRTCQPSGQSCNLDAECCTGGCVAGKCE